MKTPPGCVRGGPSPIPPWPIDKLLPSPVAKAGRWQVMHEMSRVPLRILSNASDCPRRDSAGLTYGVGGSGTTPRSAASCRTRSAGDVSDATRRPGVAPAGAIGWGASHAMQKMMTRSAAATDPHVFRRMV
jgi:hypothetical protein